MAQAEYRRQIGQVFGEVIRSPWKDLCHGLVLGGDALWQKVRKLIAEAQGDEELRLSRRADAEETSRIIESLIAQESDRRVAIWLRVRLGGEQMTSVAADYAIGMAAAFTASCSIWRKRQRAIEPSRGPLLPAPLKPQPRSQWWRRWSQSGLELLRGMQYDALGTAVLP